MRLVILSLILLAVAQVPALARPELCDAAAERAARETGVPALVLRAITRVETGRAADGDDPDGRGGGVEPWPWTTNTHGTGRWFDTPSAALAQASAAIAAGQTSVDIGCFQINWRWHGAHFPNPAALFDPLTGARYAAQMLAALHDELGSWPAAAAAYHSRSPGPNARYRARFEAMLARLGRIPDNATPAMPERRRPRSGGLMAATPLLPGAASGASLVPVPSGGRPFLIAGGS